MRTCKNGHSTPLGKIPFMPKFYFENTAISYTEELDILGITVDDKIKFKANIANICRKGRLQQVAVLKRREKISHWKEESVFTSHLSFTYCSETFEFCNKIATSKRKKINGRSLRFVKRPTMN